MILVVEDSRDARELLASQLRRRGYEVRTACNTVEALAAVRDKAPAFVLLDVMLPDEAECEKLIRAMETLPGTERTKIVITTGLPGDRPLRWPKVVSILRKPFNVDDVLSEMSNLSGVRPRPKLNPNEVENHA